MPGQSALEMGRRSAAMGDTEAGPSYLDDLVRRMTDIATIRPSPTGSRLENAGQLVPYFLPAAGAATSLVRSLTNRLRNAPAAAVETMERVPQTIMDELGVKPGFRDVKMPAVVQTATPPTGPPAAGNFSLGDMPTMIGDMPDLSGVPVSKTRLPARELTKNLQARTTGPVPDVTGSQQRTIDALLNAGMKDEAIRYYRGGGGQ